MQKSCFTLNPDVNWGPGRRRFAECRRVCNHHQKPGMVYSIAAMSAVCDIENDVWISARHFCYNDPGSSSHC